MIGPKRNILACSAWGRKCHQCGYDAPDTSASWSVVSPSHLSMALLLLGHKLIFTLWAFLKINLSATSPCLPLETVCLSADRPHRNKHDLWSQPGP